MTYAGMVKDGVGGVEGLDSARTMAFSPLGDHVYVAAQTDNSVPVLARDTLTGALSPVQALFDGVDGVDGRRSAVPSAIGPSGAGGKAHGPRPVRDL